MDRRPSEAGIDDDDIALNPNKNFVMISLTKTSEDIMLTDKQTS